MNLQGLQKMHDIKHYFDLAFGRAKKEAEKIRKSGLKGNRFQKSKTIEIEKITIIQKTLTGEFRSIMVSFPNYKELTPFYQELMKINFDVGEYRRALGGLNWLVKNIHKLSDNYIEDIKRCQELNKINSYRQQYYGRVSSLLKQVKKQLAYLEECRKILRNFPSIKTIPTVCIYGFPNVGKSTLLAKLSTATPDIKPYAFTTKKLNLGYIKEKGRKIQLIDTPGTLNRSKMNYIEKIADLALKYYGDLIVYIFDLTEASCPFADQKKLFKSLKDKSVVVYFSKTDLLEKGDADRVAGKIRLKRYFTDAKELKKEIIKTIKE